jgi:hypothetical protein
MSCPGKARNPGQRGAKVLIDGKARRSCITRLGGVAQRQITRATLPFSAAILTSCQIEMITQNKQRTRVEIGVGGVDESVDIQLPSCGHKETPPRGMLATVAWIGPTVLRENRAFSSLHHSVFPMHPQHALDPTAEPQGSPDYEALAPQAHGQLPRRPWSAVRPAIPPNRNSYAA